MVNLRFGKCEYFEKRIKKKIKPEDDFFSVWQYIMVHTNNWYVLWNFQIVYFFGHHAISHHGFDFWNDNGSTHLFYSCPTDFLLTGNYFISTEALCNITSCVMQMSKELPQAWKTGFQNSMKYNQSK